MGSFVFGFMRHTQMQQHKKESKESNKLDGVTENDHNSSINVFVDDKDGSSSSEDNDSQYQELSSRFFDPPIKFFSGNSTKS